MLIREGQNCIDHGIVYMSRAKDDLNGTAIARPAFELPTPHPDLWSFACRTDPTCSMAEPSTQIQRKVLQCSWLYHRQLYHGTIHVIEVSAVPPISAGVIPTKLSLYCPASISAPPERNQRRASAADLAAQN